jgi:penicillin amidase
MTSTSTYKPLGLALVGVALLLVVVVAAFALYLTISFHAAVARLDGVVRLPELQAPVQIVRDERAIPHIIARNEHDLFFAQGFAEGSDRLFQIDLTRHAVYGRLAEWFGGRALPADERSRIIDVRGIVARQFAKLAPRQRAQVQAFSDGINAAMRTQPLPFEYRLLVLRPELWHPQDSLAVGFATVLLLSDSYRDVLARDREYYPLSDPKYDAPTVGDASGRAGSNAWAAASLHTQSGRSLLANDPHLAPSIPGIWYLVDLRTPGYHAAGASLAGTPGVILGHNDAIAWGATNGSVAALSVFCGLKPTPADAVHENFEVRFGRTSSMTYFREKRGFYVARQGSGPESCLVAWSAYTNPTSPLETFDGLDRAASLEGAERALSRYPGPSQNFVLAQRDGRAAYRLAGWIPDDPAWARYAHRDGYRAFPILPFRVLPHVPPSRRALVWSANNKMYGEGYPFRLSATFEPPYRAFRIRMLLQERHKYDVAYFSQMQGDVYSAADLEFAKALVARAHRFPPFVRPGEGPLIRILAGWDGRYDSNSVGATVAHDTRVNETVSPLNGHDELASILQELRLNGGDLGKHRDPDVLNSAFECFEVALRACVRQTPWRDAGAVQIRHPLHGLGISWLDGPTLPGNGDKFTLHVQRTAFTQSFRAVWDVGNWDAGGIVIPCGESGEPGSPHYHDLTADWVAQRLVALPYSAGAVQRHRVAVQTLEPTKN